MKRKHAFPLLGFSALFLVLTATGCYHRTPEQRAEHMVHRLVSTLNLDARQTAKLEKMKEDFLAKRPDMMKAREESLADLKEMMLSPSLDQERLKARMDKVRDHTNETIAFVAEKFTELHDLLTPDQRAKLVAEIEKHAERHHHW